MKIAVRLCLMILGLSLFGCSKPTTKETKVKVYPQKTILSLPATTIDKSALHFNRKKSIWTLDNQLFSGYAVGYYPDSTLKEKIGFLEGRKQNKATVYYPDGQERFVQHYYRGKLHGEKKIWSADTSHTLLAHLNYHFGKAHGAQKKWYSTGEIFKILHLNEGKEEGIQQAFRKNGDLFANYEARAGRIFGLKKAALCFGLEDEKAPYEN